MQRSVATYLPPNHNHSVYIFKSSVTCLVAVSEGENDAQKQVEGLAAEELPARSYIHVE